ncbi:MAG: DNA translocase FtsK [Bacteroidales bacterium]|nr:DNA translocase FtsK [Bacteroidales bacterium]MCF8398545.1 DNA translocase FtsK [Bacteroidales bacterium]
MTKKANKLKRNDSREKRKKKSAKISQNSDRERATNRMIKFRKISGFFLFLLSFYLLFAFVSYFFTWWIDYDKIADAAQADLSGKVEIKNWTGFIGAYLSNILIKNGFGISSFFFVLILFVSGLKLALNIRLFSIGRTIIYSVVFILWLSLFFGFFFRETSLAIMGGVFGYEISQWLEGVIGWVGTVILLLFVLLSVIIIAFNLPGFFKKRKKRKKETEEAGEGNRPKRDEPEDKYNTVEFSVTEDEGIDKENAEHGHESLQDTGDNSKEPNSQKNVESDIELTIEKRKEEEQTGEQSERKGIDTDFDPTLDLPHYKSPGLNLLDEYGDDEISVRKEELEQNKNRIVETLEHYAIKIEKIKATIGPAVTLYEIIPAPGIRISKIKNLEDDIALSLAALGIRIIAPIPGKGTIGIEVPNQNPEIVSMQSILGSERFQNTPFELPMGLGKTISNESYVLDLTKLPHILMAGATGQGKSVGLNAIIASLLYKKHPAQIKFVMVDPKKVELTLFSKIERHFLAKLPDTEEAIITETRSVVRTLNSLNIEMDNRYDLLKDAQVRNIKEYNKKFIDRKLNPLEGHRFLPYIILVIDEFADLIMTAGKEIENPLTRLAQLARAIGIHLIIATQRPSVNIITGTIKANFPARIAFRVISKIDSRTILDTSGADQLIGRGDMLMSTGSDLIRLQCAFIDTHEVERVTDYIGSQRAYPEAYKLPEYEDDESEGTPEYDPNERDELFEEAAKIIVQTQQGSTSLLQRKLKLGYNRAGRIIDQLEAAGIVGPFEGSKAREVKVANEFALEQFLKDLDKKEEDIS